MTSLQPEWYKTGTIDMQKPRPFKKGDRVQLSKAGQTVYGYGSAIRGTVARVWSAGGRKYYIEVTWDKAAGPTQQLDPRHLTKVPT